MLRKTLIVIAFGMISICAVAQNSTACSDSEQIQSSLVGAFRVMNTAEAQLFTANKQFAALPDLIASEDLKRLAHTNLAKPVPNSVALGSPEDPLPGFKVSLLVSADGQHYTLSATKASGECRLVGLSTNDSGIIYLIVPLR